METLKNIHSLLNMKRMKRFLTNQRQRVRALLEDDSNHALYDHRGYIRP